jgi:hypothetical protein
MSSGADSKDGGDLRPNRAEKTEMSRLFIDVRKIERMKQGPWGRCRTLYADRLHVRDYSRPSGRRKLQLAADFGRPVRLGEACLPEQLQDIAWRKPGYLAARVPSGSKTVCES